MKKIKNEVNELGCLPTINGIMGRQGYHVYSADIACSVTAQTGGLGGSSGLYVVKNVNSSDIYLSKFIDKEKYE